MTKDYLRSSMTDLEKQKQRMKLLRQQHTTIRKIKSDANLSPAEQQCEIRKANAYYKHQRSRLNRQP